MRILWFTWKDLRHPLAGGAEVVNEELAQRLAADGHQVTFVVGGFDGGAAEDSRDGFRILRVGGRWTVYWEAMRLYKRKLRGTADLVIDEINTVPFFCKWYVQEKNIVFAHQLCRKIWFYEMFLPLSFIGYALEPWYLHLLSDRQAITVSQSSKDDLVLHHFASEKVHVIPQGLSLVPAADISVLRKPAKPTVLAFGSVRPMKRTFDALVAFTIAKRRLPDLQLVIAGSTEGRYGRQLLREIAKSPYKDDIRCLGHVPTERKAAVLADAHLLLATSVKEGWCLVVSEAAGQGTPAVVYDVDGLRDSVRQGQTGAVVPEGDVGAMADEIMRLCSGEPAEYERLRRNAWEFAKTLTYDASYAAFAGIIKHL